MTFWTWNSERGAFESVAEVVAADPVISPDRVVGSDLAPGRTPDPTPLLLADSWFVCDGKVRAFDRHRARFTAAARRLNLPVPMPEAWAQAAQLMRAPGEWFPRIEVVNVSHPAHGQTSQTSHPPTPQLRFRMRPAPPRPAEVCVWVPLFADPRRAPATKGPDIAALEWLRGQARDRFTCAEVVLTTPESLLIEAATSNVVWWDDGCLCVPHPDVAPFKGVTQQLVVEQARARGFPVEYRRVRPADIFAQEVWLLNALHGIRRVNGWVMTTSAINPATTDATINRATTVTTDATITSVTDARPAPGWFWEWRTWLESLRTEIR